MGVPAPPGQGRVLAIDWGERYLGFAVSDEGQCLARPLGVHRRGELAADLEAVVGRMDGVVEIVVGRPRRTDGRPGPSEAKALEFTRWLQDSVGCPVNTCDEWLTTVIAQQRMASSGRMPGRVDAEAAAVLLQGYLDRQARSMPRKQRENCSGKKGGIAVPGDEEFGEEEWVTLTDEDGQDHDFAILDVIEVDNREYAVLVPAESDGESEDEDAVIFRLETGQDGNDVLVNIEDDQEWDRVAGVWETMSEAEVDGEDDPETED